MAKAGLDKASLETVLGEESYPEGRIVSRVQMRRDRRTGTLSYTASAMRALDRLRALLQDIQATSSPGHIRSLREVLGLTQQQLATRLDVSSQTVSRWERGQVRPSAAMLRRLRAIQKSALRSGIAVSSVGPGSLERHRGREARSA